MDSAEPTDATRLSPPADYKRTQVGLIPKDWEVKSILELVRLPKGQVDPKIEPYRSMILVAPDHIQERTGLLLQCVTAADQGAISGKFPFAPGDVVYSKIRPYLRKAFLADFEGISSADMYPLRPVGNTSSLFILNTILGDYFSYFAISVSARSGIPKINRLELAQISVPTPSLREQRVIGAALSDADALIESLDRLIAKKRAIRQVAMQQLLAGERQLPGFGGAWKTRRLGYVLSFQVGFPFKSEFFNSEGRGVRLVRNGDLKGDDIVLYYEGSYDSAFEVNEGDILVGMDGEFVPHKWHGGKALLNQRVGRIHGSSELDGQFAYYRLAEPLKEIERATSATTVKHLSHGDVASIEIPLPDIEEQSAIAQVLSDMEAEIEALERRSFKARQIKHGMMQELLTGRTRLVEPQQEAVEKAEA